MRVVLAPNAFKGSLSARQACEAMALGVRRACPEAEIVAVPVADGGDGVVEVLIDALAGEARAATVCDPVCNPVKATFCYLPRQRLAAIEMASASGLALLDNSQRNPLHTTTLGTGELMAAALELGVERIIIGIGGSATNDGGVGMATALGARFLDDQGCPVKPDGGDLHRIRRIDLSALDPRLSRTEIDVMCDVDNPLLGPRGAAHVYGPQKGATPGQARILEMGLAHLAAVIERDLGLDIRTLRGAGAAGGLGAGLCAFAGARLRRGIDVILELVELRRHLAGADLAFTAEGQIDFQTRYGKAPAGVAACAREQHIPCIALAGGLGDNLGELHDAGFSALFSLCPGPVPLEQAMSGAAVYLSAATEQALRCFIAGRKASGHTL